MFWEGRTGRLLKRRLSADSALLADSPLPALKRRGPCTVSPSANHGRGELTWAILNSMMPAAGAQLGMLGRRSAPPQSTTLNEERKCILIELDRVPAATGVIALHPAVLARYEEQLNQLQTGLAKGIASGDSGSAEAMRDLIETVTVFRDPSRIGGIVVEIAGRLTALLGEGAFPHGVQGVGGMVVAGEGLELLMKSMSWARSVNILRKISPQTKFNSANLG